MPVEVKWAISFLVGGLILFAGWKVPFLLLTFYILVCIVLAIVVLLQSGTAADLAGAFGGAGSQTAFGPRGAATFLSRATTWCAIVFMMTSLTLSVKRTPTDQVGTGSILEQTQKSGTVPEPAKSAHTQPAQFPLPPAPASAPPAAPAPAQQQPTPAPAQNSAPKK